MKEGKLSDSELHLLAGLVYVGKNEEGDDEWLGTDKEWSFYEFLFNEQPYEKAIRLSSKSKRNRKR